MGGFSTVTPSGGSVNATSVAQAVWSYSPRSLTDIQSLVSAIQNNDPNLLSSLSDLQYLPIPYFVGQVSVTQVAAFMDNTIRNYNLAGAFANFIGNNPYNLWSSGFVASIAAAPYITATALSMLISQASMDANHAQAMLYSLAQNYYYNKWINTVTASAPTSITFSTNVTLSNNVIIAQNITIASGVTVTCGTTTCFFVAQSFNNYGTIVNPRGAAGASPPSGAGAGGNGGGGIVVIAITAALGTLNVSGNNGGSGSGNTIVSPGNNGAGGAFYAVTGVVVATGGNSSVSSGAPGHNGGAGGGDNSPMANEFGGNGGNATVHSFSSPNAMVTYILQGLSDWFLNMLGKSPSSVTPLAFMYGSGGGSGAVASGYGSGGGGGGGAGEVVAYGYNILSGTVDAVGGNGGAGYGSYNGGGGGGGGGLAFVFYGATSGSITANLAGGIGGTGSSGNGNTGFSGTLYIAAVTVNG